MKPCQFCGSADCKRGTTKPCLARGDLGVKIFWYIFCVLIALTIFLIALLETKIKRDRVNGHSTEQTEQTNK